MNKFLKLVEKYNNRLVSEQEGDIATVPATPDSEVGQMTQIPNAPESALPNAAPQVQDTPIIALLKKIPDFFEYKGSSDSQQEILDLLTGVNENNLETVITTILDKLSNQQAAKIQERDLKKELNPSREENQTEDPAEEE